MEGVVPKPVPVIEKGLLTNFLLTRQPVRGYEGSNGRARLPGSYGAKAPLFSNLFIKARETVSSAELKQKLIDMLKQRGKPYGIIIRKLDFPTAMTLEELRRMSSTSSQRGASSRTVSVPSAIFKIYPDGREELIRGMRFRSLTVRSLRDIVAASADEAVFHFIGNGSALPSHNLGGYVAGHTVAAPALLFEDMELDRREEDWSKLPLAPPPDITVSN
jgi:predicted Zn-dependent protease